jgi:hypothetical protein
VKCDECGADFEHGTEDCNTLWLNMTLRSPDERRLVVRRVVVDTYALQHPRRMCATPQTLASHLLGLCCAVEHGGNLNIYAGVKGFLKRTKDLPELEPPEFLGELTVFEVAQAVTLDEHVEGARKWARCVWEAWYEHHDLVRAWIREIDSR